MHFVANSSTLCSSEKCHHDHQILLIYFSLRHHPILLQAWSTAGPTRDWHYQLHKPWQHCQMLCSPQTTIQEVPNYATNFLNLHYVLVHGHQCSIVKPYFAKWFLIAVGITNFQASAKQCTADNIFNFTHEASWSCPPSIITADLLPVMALGMHGWFPNTKDVDGS